MVQDAIDGKMDMIITKSISRFARNTVDTLKYVRLLKEKNVAMFFEEENINTMTMDGELLLTILSSVAQQEVHNTSEHVKKGLKMKMQRGELIGFQGCLGYDYDPKTKEIRVNPEEAKTIKYIFKRYVEGVGATVIARELTDLGYTTKKGDLNWGLSAIIGIIKNEKYKVDILLGKTYTVDPISKRRLKNFGESDKFYIEGHHEAIIPAETFDLANKIREQRACPRRGCNQYNDKTRERITRAYSFSSILQCGFCGQNLTRRTKEGKKDGPKICVWQCISSTKKGKSMCPHSLAVDEALLQKAFLEAINRLVGKDGNSNMKDFLSSVETALLSESFATKITDTKAKIAELEKKKDNILELRMSGVVSQEDCESKYKIINQELDLRRSELNDYNGRQDNQGEVKARLKSFRETILSHEGIDCFSEDILESTVDKIIVGGMDENGKPDSHRLNFVFKSELSHRDFIGKFDASKAVRIREFDCDYDHCIFEKGPSGERRKLLLKKVHVVISANIGGYENEDRIQID